MIQLSTTPRILLGRILLWCFIILWEISVLSSDFRDPSFFNQVYPSEGLKNWVGLGGALLGGSLVELLGPAAMLLPWMLIRIQLDPRPQESKWLLLYHSLTLTFVLSAIHVLYENGNVFDPDSRDFLWKEGYLGQLAVDWITSYMGETAAILLCGLLCFYTVIQVSSVLSPLEPLLILYKFAVYLLVILKNRIQQSAFWGESGDSAEKKNPLHQTRPRTLAQAGTSKRAPGN